MDRGRAASLGGGEEVNDALARRFGDADAFGKTLIAPLGFLRLVDVLACLDDGERWPVLSKEVTLDCGSGLV